MRFRIPALMAWKKKKTRFGKGDGVFLGGFTL